MRSSDCDLWAALEQQLSCSPNEEVLQTSRKQSERRLAYRNGRSHRIHNSQSPVEQLRSYQFSLSLQTVQNTPSTEARTRSIKLGPLSLCSHVDHERPLVVGGCNGLNSVVSIFRWIRRSLSDEYQQANITQH